MESTTHGTSPGAGRMGEPEEPHGHTEPMPHHHVNYFMIFLVLVALTIITVVVALKRFDNELINLLLAMLVASIKAICVAMYFMHLKFEGKLIYLIMIVPLILCVILIAALIPDIAFALPFNRMTELPGPHGH
jgi:cytochrome c oxidase subunit 4